MTDAELIERAKATFVLDTPTERLARDLIGVAERAIAINASATCLYCEQTMPKTEVWAHVRQCLDDRRAQ